MNSAGTKKNEIKGILKNLRNSKIHVNAISGFRLTMSENGFIIGQNFGMKGSAQKLANPMIN